MEAVLKSGLCPASSTDGVGLVQNNIGPVDCRYKARRVAAQTLLSLLGGTV